MFDALKKLKYGVRVMLSRGGGQPETVQIAGRPTVITSGGEGEPFVYLHSTLGESQLWLPFFQTWARQYRVLAPMHPGFGQSGGFDEIDTIEDMAFHYIELLDALGLEQVILGGVSLGGWIAAEVAVRWPERVKKLWLAAAPGVPAEGAAPGDLFRCLQNPRRMREILFHDPNGPMASLIIKDQPDEQQQLAAYQHLTVLARLVWERPYDPKLAARLHRVTCPTLLLWGDSDRLVPPAIAEAYQKHLPQAERTIIKDCGHLLMFEREAEFVDTVLRFCKG